MSTSEQVHKVMDHTTETRGARSIPADKLAALYAAKAERDRLRGAIEEHRYTIKVRQPDDAEDHPFDARLWAALDPEGTS